MSSNLDETDHSKSHSDNITNIQHALPATGGFQQVDKIRVAEIRNGSGSGGGDQVRNSSEMQSMHLTSNKTEWVKFEDDDKTHNRILNIAKDVNGKIVLDSSVAAEPLSVAAAKEDDTIPDNDEQVNIFLYNFCVIVCESPCNLLIVELIK